ncbi:MAG: hypothetical protein H3C62_17555 [Gemmatimonadaceae bacterium]|nr:hypothetical protein [Gemmatimonadaceae bacterium]
MQITLPVYLYDVVTTADPPRLVVTCRTPDAQSELVRRLNDAPLDGGEVFTMAPMRVGAVAMEVEAGSSVTVRGYEIASEVLAATIAAATPAPEPAPEPVPDAPAPVDPAPEEPAP